MPTATENVVWCHPATFQNVLLPPGIGEELLYLDIQSTGLCHSTDNLEPRGSGHAVSLLLDNAVHPGVVNLELSEKRGEGIGYCSIARLDEALKWNNYVRNLDRQNSPVVASDPGCSGFAAEWRCSFQGTRATLIARTVRPRDRLPTDGAVFHAQGH